MTHSVRRVLLVCHFYPPHMGGIERVVQAEASRLAYLVALTCGDAAASASELRR